jgi:hypothetical protein
MPREGERNHLARSLIDSRWSSTVGHYAGHPPAQVRPYCNRRRARCQYLRNSGIPARHRRRRTAETGRHAVVLRAVAPPARVDVDALVAALLQAAPPAALHIVFRLDTFCAVADTRTSARVTTTVSGSGATSMAPGSRVQRTTQSTLTTYSTHRPAHRGRKPRCRCGRATRRGGGGSRLTAPSPRAPACDSHERRSARRFGAAVEQLGRIHEVARPPEGLGGLGGGGRRGIGREKDYRASDRQKQVPRGGRTFRGFRHQPGRLALNGNTSRRRGE